MVALGQWLLPGALTVCAGALFVLGLAPFDFWPAIPASAALWLALLHRFPRIGGFTSGWLYGIGLFAAGSSWIYVSIHIYGRAAPPLAALLTGLFCAGLALLTAVQGHVYRRWLQSAFWWSPALAFPALWVLFEWLRSWLLTGFPWLYAGYAGIDTPIAGWAPVIGVYGLSFWLIAMGSALVATVWSDRSQRRALAVTLAVLVVLAGLGTPLKSIAWTQVAGQPMTVALYQPNIPLERKWDRRYFRRILTQYAMASGPLYEQADLLLWPESALPALRSAITDYLDDIDERGRVTGTSVITGIPVKAESGLHNSIIGLGAAEGEYHKQKLVPFGEYVPLEQWLRGLIAFFDLPMSSFVPGPAVQPVLQANEWRVAPFICYEVVYPDFVARGAQGANLLITVSNDSWFGDSIGPLQHLQMARFRALETGRAMLRGTNNGVSAIINPDGLISAQTEQFVETTLTGSVTPRSGYTPFMLTGSLPILTFCALILIVVHRARRP